MKQFKIYKKKKKRKFVKIIFVFFFFFSYAFMIKYCQKNKFKKNTLNKEINYISFNINDYLSSKINNIVDKPVYFLNDNIKNAKVSINSKSNDDIKKSINKVVDKNTVNTNKDNPIIYIYNTHQNEDYDNYTIYDASLNFASKLNNNGISTLFEEQSITTFLQDNNLKYYKSYEASKKFIIEAKDKYPSIKYFIDFHRDSVNKNKSTMNYNNKNYAKILFIVGLDNKNYNKNLDNANKLNNIIESIVPNISRGIMKKQGKGVNGIYNQDISDNLFLIEVGGMDNTKQEVDNTMDIIYDALIKYIGEII